MINSNKNNRRGEMVVKLYSKFQKRLAALAAGAILATSITRFK